MLACAAAQSELLDSFLPGVPAELSAATGGSLWQQLMQVGGAAAAPAAVRSTSALFCCMQLLRAAVFSSRDVYARTGSRSAGERVPRWPCASGSCSCCRLELERYMCGECLGLPHRKPLHWPHALPPQRASSVAAVLLFPCCAAHLHCCRHFDAHAVALPVRLKLIGCVCSAGNLVDQVGQAWADVPQGVQQGHLVCCALGVVVQRRHADRTAQYTASSVVCRVKLVGQLLQQHAACLPALLRLLMVFLM